MVILSIVLGSEKHATRPINVSNMSEHSTPTSVQGHSSVAYASLKQFGNQAGKTRQHIRKCQRIVFRIHARLSIREVNDNFTGAGINHPYEHGSGG